MKPLPGSIITFISIFRHNIKVLDSLGQETNEFIVSIGRFVKLLNYFTLNLTFDRKGLSCYRLGLFLYLFIRILPGLLLTCKFLSSRSFFGCQFDHFNIYLLGLETFFDNHLFLPPGAAKAEGPLGRASMQLSVFS